MDPNIRLHWRRQNVAPYRPRNGLMLLFPAFLMHTVSPHRGIDPRISVAFNLVLRGPRGTDLTAASSA